MELRAKAARLEQGAKHGHLDLIIDELSALQNAFHKALDLLEQDGALKAPKKKT